MRKTPIILAVLLVVAVIATTTTLAVHYRNLSEHYRLQAARAAAELAERHATIPAPGREMAAVVVAPAPAAGVPPTEDAGLRDRIRLLEAQVAEKDTFIAALRDRGTNRPPDRSLGRRDRFGGPESMRTNNPAMFAEFEKRRQEAQQRMQDAFARKAEYLLKKDVSKLSEGEKARHDELVKLLDETWKLTQQMQGDLPWEDRREAMRSMRENMMALEPMLLAERNKEFESLGISLGYNQADAANFSAYLADVIDLTSVQSLFQGFRPPSPRERGEDAGATQNSRVSP